MAERFKLGISRNRLFEPFSCVSFRGKSQEMFDETELNKAFRMLTAREPLLTSAVEVDSDGEAYLVTEKCKPAIVFDLCDDTESFYRKKKNESTAVFSQPFEFYVLNGNELFIFSHTAVADARSLLILSKELIAYYKKESTEVSSLPVFLFSDKNNIPVNVQTPITDKVAADLDAKWERRKHKVAVEKCLRSTDILREKYGNITESTVLFSKEKTEELRRKCYDEKTDFATKICWELHKSLKTKYTKGKTPYYRVDSAVDYRLFTEEPYFYGVGSLSSYVSIFGAKNKDKKAKGEFRAFHDEYFRKSVSSFHAFYDDFLLIQLSPYFGDSAYLYAAGLMHNKAAKRLATKYTCLNKRLLASHCYNLDSEYWRELHFFRDVSLCEPNRLRNDFSLTVLFFEGQAKVTVISKAKMCDDAALDRIAQELLTVC